MVRRQTIGIARQTWTLDPTMRLRGWTTETNSGTWTQTGAKTNHYAADAGGADSPTWITETGSTVTRNVTGIAGDLAAYTDGATANVFWLQLTTLHGDVGQALHYTSATISDSALAYDNTEYGAKKPGTTNPAYGRYAWLGGKQRSIETVANTLILMGVRLYNPVTGRFISVDPIVGGSANGYDYCSADPLNCLDLTGRGIFGDAWDKVKGGAKKATRYRPTGWLIFDKMNDHFVMRRGRIGFHWNNHQSRIEYGLPWGWHYNSPSGGHYSVWTGVRAGAGYLGRMAGNLRFPAPVIYPNWIHRSDPYRRIRDRSNTYAMAAESVGDVDMTKNAGPKRREYVLEPPLVCNQFRPWRPGTLTAPANRQTALFGSIWQRRSAHCRRKVRPPRGPWSRRRFGLSPSFRKGDPCSRFESIAMILRQSTRPPPPARDL